MEGTKQCNTEWSYQEVRRLADLTVEEMQHFEESMARLALADHCEVQEVSEPVIYVLICFSFLMLTPS